MCVVLLDVLLLFLSEFLANFIMPAKYKRSQRQRARRASLASQAKRQKLAEKPDQSEVTASGRKLSLDPGAGTSAGNIDDEIHYDGYR